MLFPPLPKHSSTEAKQAKQAKQVWRLRSAHFMRQRSEHLGSPAAALRPLRRAVRVCAAGAAGIALTFGVLAAPHSASAQTTGQVVNTDDVDKLMKTTTTQPTAGGSGGGGSLIQINPTPALLTPVALPAANVEVTPTTKKKKKKKSTKPKTTKSETSKPETVKVVAVLDRNADATDPAAGKSESDAKADGKTDKSSKSDKSDNTDGKSGSKADAAKDDKTDSKKTDSKKTDASKDDTKKSDAKKDDAKKDDTKKVTASTIEPAKESGGVADSTWAALRKCESGGNYKINTGNGYYGAYQFSAQTWRSLGYPGLPHQAEPDVQDEAARRLQAKAGWGQWPACSRKLGLR